MGVNWFSLILQAITWASLLFTHIDGCGDLPNMSHALPVEKNLTTPVLVGTGVRYDCVAGYRAVSGLATAVCQQVNGSNLWTIPTLKCELEGCGALLNLHNQIPNITGDFRGPPFPIGTNVHYQCDRGYVSEGGSTDSVCILKDGKAIWDPPTFTCRGVSCGDPKLVNHADRIGHVFTFPDQVKYVCHEGYETEDPVELYCLPNSLWSHGLPTCKAIHCPDLTNPDKGSVDAKDTSFKSFAKYRCDEGYRLNGLKEIQCMSNRAWSGIPPNCIKVSCPQIKEIPNGQVTQLSSTSTHEVGNIIFFKCHSPDNTRYTSKCLDSGEWYPSPPICKAPPAPTTTPTIQPTEVVTDVGKQAKERVQCGNPGNISHGFSSNYNETLPENSNITYTCLPGYKLKGQPTLICTSHGRWSPGIVPACEKPLTVEVIVGIVLGVVAFIIILVSTSLYCYRWRKRRLIHRNKACIIDAKDSDEIRTLERDKKYIPVTSL